MKTLLPTKRIGLQHLIVNENSNLPTQANILPIALPFQERYIDRSFKPVAFNEYIAADFDMYRQKAAKSIRLFAEPVHFWGWVFSI